MPQGAGQRFAISQVHVAEGRPKPAMRWVRQFYLLMIPLTIGLMLLHNGGDWMRKLLRLRAGRRRPTPGTPRIPRAVPTSACCPSSVFDMLFWSSRF